MSCTPEEIEKKRLAALEKRQNKLIKDPAVKSIAGCDTSVGPIKTHNSSSRATLHPYAKSVNSTDYNKSSSSRSTPGILFSSPNKVSSQHYSQSQTRNQSEVVTVKLILVSENRFEVTLSKLFVPLIDIFKTVSSKHFDSIKKVWNFSIDDHQELISKMTSLEPYIIISPIPQFVLKILKYPIRDSCSLDLMPIEEELKNKLMPFQQDGVRFGIARRGRCIIADEMGLGKTYQALAIASYYRTDWPLLIVTTSSMRDTWLSKIHELLPSEPMSNIATLANNKDCQVVADKQTEIVITSYKIAGMHKELLNKKEFGVVIIDESHHLKSYKAQCTSTIMTIANKSARAVLLSGTPALSRPAELYTQLALIETSVLNSYNSYVQFGLRYCEGKKTEYGWDMSGESNLGELQVLLRKRFLIRRTKEQVLQELADITRETVMLDETLLNYTDEDHANLNEMAETYNKSSSSKKHSALITYFSSSAHIKVPAVCKYIKQMLKEYTGKFLVFAHHRTMIEALCRTLDETNTQYICIVGSTPAHTRTGLVESFQCAAEVRAAVLSITAAGAGLTLTAAGLVLFAELHWNPGVLTQAEARAHRLGRRGGVVARYLLARATADDAMWPMLHGKLQVLNGVGLSDENFEDTAMKHQESSNSITQYLSPKPNKNNYIPGTNILKSSRNSTNNENTQNNTKHSTQTEEQDVDMLWGVSDLNLDEVDEFIMNYDEDDNLLANVDI